MRLGEDFITGKGFGGLPWSLVEKLLSQSDGISASTWSQLYAPYGNGKKRLSGSRPGKDASGCSL